MRFQGRNLPPESILPALFGWSFGIRMVSSTPTGFYKISKRFVFTQRFTGFHMMWVQDTTSKISVFCGNMNWTHGYVIFGWIPPLWGRTLRNHQSKSLVNNRLLKIKQTFFFPEFLVHEASNLFFRKIPNIKTSPWKVSPPDLGSLLHVQLDGTWDPPHQVMREKIPDFPGSPAGQFLFNQQI